MAQGKGLPKMTQSGGGYPAGHVKTAMQGVHKGTGVPQTKRDYKQPTPTYMNTAVTHQGVTVRKTGK